MAILVDDDTRLVVQGLTGREGRFHALRNRAYGTKVVAGVRAGKGGQDVEGIPVFDTVAQAVAGTGANTSLIFVPARSAVDALFEAVDAGIGTVVMITENIPVLDLTHAYGYVRACGATLVGPNGPGVISPGKANVGIIPGEITHAGPVGLVSRSGTLTYQVMYEMATAGVGQTTCVGIGGDPVVGSNFIDVLHRFEGDQETEAVVMIGEIGGDEEEQAAAFVAERMTKPVVAYIAGFEAPPGRRMGHAGAIISGSSGTAQAKAKALEAAGVRVGRNPTETAELAVTAVSSAGISAPRRPPDR
ncbi:MAG TPA: succinate--CoA ligase subunit alpha [Actinomycetes bacterium]|jgi:succinyl-CoA synthetase alpha subunit|nr:succinate--CoA ligase subunit alpha [Actinomycetes bacterium]